MTVNYQKLRVGAPDTMILDADSGTQVDCGASLGGATLAYAATYLPVMIDQTIMPASAFKTKEDVMFSVSLVQETAQILQAAFSMGATSIVTVASGAVVAPPAAPTLTVNGTGAAVTYSYAIVAFNNVGDSVPGALGTTAVGPTTLSTANNIKVAWAAPPAGATGIKVQRTVGGLSTGIIATIYTTAAGSILDTALVATAYTAAITGPTYPNTDTLNFGGNLNVPFHTFMWQVPKNDGTTNHWIGFFRRCYSGKAVSVDWKRDKVTEVSKIELVALADTTQAVGSQAGWVAEQY